MTRKTVAIVLSVLFLLAAMVPAARAQWSAEQRSVVAVLQAAVQAEKDGDYQKVAPLYHDQFMAWNLADRTPTTRTKFLAETAEFLKTAKIVDFEVVPITIAIVKDTAVVAATYAYTVVPNGGQFTKLAGRWTITLVKKDATWLYLGCTWIDTK